MTDNESIALLERFRARDEAALADLYDLAGARAYGLAFRVLQHGPAAEGVVQSAFATLWEQADRLDGDRGSIDTLLLAIVHRRAVDAARNGQRQLSPQPLEAEPHEGEAPPEDGAAADAEAQERAREVLAALRVLPEPQRQVLLLAYFDGMSQQDLAEGLDVPLGTVKSRLRLAMQRLRHEFNPPEVRPTDVGTNGTAGSSTDEPTDG